MWALADERGGTRATLAVVTAYRAARGDYDRQDARPVTPGLGNRC
jgi:hypothetical protein